MKTHRVVHHLTAMFWSQPEGTVVFQDWPAGFSYTGGNHILIHARPIILDKSTQTESVTLTSSELIWEHKSNNTRTRIEHVTHIPESADYRWGVELAFYFLVG